MTDSLAIEPPAGYTLFASHAQNGWDFWVPPPDADIKTRLQGYQFINQGANKIGKYGPPPSVSAGSAMPDPKKPYSVEAWDVQNYFSPYGGGEQPYIPQFVALWCSYVIAIAPQYGWTQIVIGSVVNNYFGDLLDSLGFDEVASATYLGVMTTIDTKVRTRSQEVGWQFATATARQWTNGLAAKSVSQ